MVEKQRVLTHREVHHAANEALLHGYKERDLVRYFREKGFSHFEIFKIISSTRFRLYQSLIKRIGDVGFVNMALGLLSIVIAFPYKRDSWFSYYLLFSGVIFLGVSYYSVRTKRWVLFSGLGLVVFDFILCLFLVGSIENVLLLLVIKIWLTSLVFLQLLYHPKGNKPKK
ncbi:MAG: hypothetical protein WCP97_01025 [bacterium]